jgi:hypothetical protein
VAGVEVITVTYHAIGYPGGPPVISLWVALFSAAALGRQATALVGLLCWLAISVLAQLVFGNDGVTYGTNAGRQEVQRQMRLERPGSTDVTRPNPSCRRLPILPGLGRSGS